MSALHFISDLHLCPTRPAIAERFIAYLEREARTAGGLCILGDLFEYWAGDDDLDDPFNKAICAALKGVAASNVTIRFIAGNRDFLIGERFAAAAGLTLLAEPTLLDVAGTPTLLLHGDLLCTADLAYLEFRNKVRTPQWQQDFLARPLAERKAHIEDLRRQSREAQKLKPMALVDVDEDAISDLLAAHGHPPRIIHGHTHRPACHRREYAAHPCERWVLAAWDDQPSYLAVTKQGCRQISLI